MDETLLKLRILAKAELALAQLHGRVLVNRLLLAVLAVGALVLAIGMVNVGLFELLETRYGSAPAAFLVALVNAIVAALLLIKSARMEPGTDEQLVHEIRDMALAELSTEAESFKEGVAEVTGDIERIQKSLHALTDNATAGLAALGPLLGLGLEALRGRSKS
jgi:hypothetical protein